MKKGKEPCNSQIYVDGVHFTHLIFKKVLTSKLNKTFYTDKKLDNLCIYIGIFILI